MSLETEVKSMILQIADRPDRPDDLPGDTVLSDLGYSTNMANKLANELQKIANNHHTGAVIQPGSITPSSTVDECIAATS